MFRSIDVICMTCLFENIYDLNNFFIQVVRDMMNTKIILKYHATTDNVMIM